jgi:hypothetical protein
MDKGYRKAIDQRYNVWRSNSNTSSRELSRFSKHLRFLSLQIHQKMHIGTIFHVVALLDLPDFHQQATRSSTLLGMTQEIPKREKMLFHKADATSQCKRSLECNLSLSLSFFFFFGFMWCIWRERNARSFEDCDKTNSELQLCYYYW